MGIGGNQGDVAATFVGALEALRVEPGVEVRAVSPVYETPPFGYADQAAFLNAVIEVETSLPALALLHALQRIELAFGRDRSGGGPRFGPRPLDLDLLFLGAQRIESWALKLPHPGAHERVSVLVPLCALAPDFVHPVLGESVAELLARRPDQAAARPLPDPPGWPALRRAPGDAGAG